MDYGQRPEQQGDGPGDQQTAGAGYEQGPTGQPGGYGPAPGQAGDYGQPGGYQAPPKKAGFNWLACCGIGCGVVLVITLLVGMLMWKSCAPLFEMGKQAETLTKEVRSSNAEQVRAEASYVDSTELGSIADTLAGQWIAVEGVVLGLDAMSGSSFSSGGFNSSDSTSYLLEGGVMVLDMSKAPNVASVGDTMIAYGKCVVFDMTKLPFIGGIMEQAAKEDPELAAMGGKMIFFFTQDVEKTGDAADNQDGSAGDDQGSPPE
jgi:hypothetical protein